MKSVNEGNPLRLKDTKWLQLLSLDNFAEALGYSREEGEGRYSNPENPKRLYMSFKTMSFLHNYNFSRGGFHTVTISGKKVIKQGVLDFYEGVFTPHQMYKAIGKKIITCSKLEFNKKSKVIVVNDNQIKFV